MSRNLSESLRKSASRYPNREAFRFMKESMTFEQLNHQVNRFASSLSVHGIGKGDTVALLIGNNPCFVTAYYGALRTGAAVVPINPIYSAREIAYILSNSHVKGVISDSSLYPALTSMKNHLPDLKFVVYTDPIELEECFDSFLQGDAVSFTPPEMEEEDLAVILYTSGTTGDPKGAMLTHRNMVSNAEACIELFELSEIDRVLTVLPIFHVFCMTVCLNASIASGATMLILPKFSPSEVVKTIREEKATLFAGVPTMYNFLYQLPDARADDFTSVRCCVSGGAPIPVALLYKFEEKYQVRVLEGYGLSEASPVTTFNPMRGIRKPGSIGKDIPGVQNKIVDEEGQEVPRGEIGELIVQGPNVMKGYLGMPEATRLALRDGWLYTGDLGKMDSDGYVYIVDRKKDMIIVGGYNVYPREVEEILYQHPSVLEAAVIGVPDEEYGETVKAFVVTKQEGLSKEDLTRFCEGKIAKYKIPKYVEFIKEMPKNSTGKIVRRALRST